MFTLHNIHDGQIVHQKCVIITGRCNSYDVSETQIQVETANEAGRRTFPTHNWPICDGWFKCLVILSAGTNVIQLRAARDNQHTTEAKVHINYVPLLDTPPLHLAIMLAADSNLEMDCPPCKGGVGSAHSGLDAAVAKLRMAACMWQALTAEEMRKAGLGCRSFRLEEEWGADTLSQSFSTDPNSLTSFLRSTIKVHIVKSDKTLAQIRDPEIAQQNEKARNKNGLHGIFLDALKRQGPPFEDRTRPVIAGLILDSHYHIASDLITGHAALGSHNPIGISLGIFGSHLAYAWPRFLEEVPDCLLDTTPPGNTVGNDCNGCPTNWEACTVGMTAFIHEVGHAFSAPHTSGIMGGGCSRDFPKCFLSTVAYSGVLNRRDQVPVISGASHLCYWSLEDMLRFFNQPQFRRPSDPEPSSAHPIVTVEGRGESLRMVINCRAGMADVTLNGSSVGKTSVANPVRQILIRVSELETRYNFNRKSPLRLQVLSMNGKHTEYPVWKLLSRMASVQVPGTDIYLRRKAVGQPSGEEGDWPWAVMLKKRDQRGHLVKAIKVDMRVGWRLDGAEVYFEDGTKIPCGIRGQDGNDPDMGGHLARKMFISRKGEITKILVSRVDQKDLCGLRMHLSNGKAMGALNKHYAHVVEPLSMFDPLPSGIVFPTAIFPPEASRIVLTFPVADEGQVIIGFYGTTSKHSRCNEFGIITAPKNTELPDWLYDMPELQNNPKDSSGSRLRPRDGNKRYSVDTSEDQDGGYDCDLDIDESQ